MKRTGRAEMLNGSPRVFFASALLCLSATAQAQAPQLPTWPVKPVRVIVPMAAGGGSDSVARIMSAKLGDVLGQQFVVDNRGGGGGLIGIGMVVKAAPDGYTLMLISGSVPATIAAHKPPYDALGGLAGVIRVGYSPLTLVVHPSIPVRSVKEMIAFAKAKPGQLSYSSSGAGTTGHMAMELLKQMAAIDMVAVHYKGGGPALIDLIAGRVSPGFATILSAAPHIEGGRLRALAVSTPKRSSALPDLPTVAEAGVPGYEFTGWWGVVVPARTPHAVISKLNGELVKILAQPDVRERLVREGADPASTTPEAFTAYMRSEVAKWSKVIKTANIKAE